MNRTQQSLQGTLTITETVSRPKGKEGKLHVLDPIVIKTFSKLRTADFCPIGYNSGIY